MSAQHVVERARERYGLSMTEADVELISAAIREKWDCARYVGPMRYSERDSVRHEKWTLAWGDVELRVLWDADHDRVRTVMPRVGRPSATFGMDLGKVLGWKP